MSKLIGIVGGVGPKAGEHLHAKILANTRAAADAEHLPILLYTNPRIPDRADFVLGKTQENPAHEILRTLQVLVKAGAQVLCVPCNTAHAPPIWDVVTDGFARLGADAELLSIVGLTVDFLVRHFPNTSHAGILSTCVTRDSGVYQAALGHHNVRAVFPTEANQRHVQAAIYDPDWGIKGQSAPVTQRARDALAAAAVRLIADGAEAIILGCTEIPLAFPGPTFKGVPVIDSAAVLARELIRRAAGEDKLTAQPK